MYHQAKQQHQLHCHFQIISASLQVECVHYHLFLHHSENFCKKNLDSIFKGLYQSELSRHLIVINGISTSGHCDSAENSGLVILATMVTYLQKTNCKTQAKKLC